MNELITIQANTWYQRAEQKAVQYYASLQTRAMDHMYVQTLTTDFQLWKKTMFPTPGIPGFHAAARRPMYWAIINISAG